MERNELKISSLEALPERMRYDSHYESPKIEIVEIQLEKGFADSISDFGEENW